MQLPTLICKSKPLRVDPEPESWLFHEAWAVVFVQGGLGLRQEGRQQEVDRVMG